MNQTLIEVKRLEHGMSLPLPSYATLQSAGMDLMAAINQLDKIVIEPMERILVPTGIAIALPTGFEAQVRPRSGLAIKYGITIPNAPGTVDADYRGEILVPLLNLSKEPFILTYGMRIAQMVIAKYEQINWNIVSDLSQTARGDRGFGSTGI